jgi:hypothetical protein
VVSADRARCAAHRCYPPVPEHRPQAVEVLRGGDDRISNLQTHASCNYTKGRGDPPVWAVYR